jgi:hypothetical protein
MTTDQEEQAEKRRTFLAVAGLLADVGVVKSM